MFETETQYGHRSVEIGCTDLTKLTKAQIKFIEGQNIPISSMFDASGMTRAEYKAAMEDEEKHFAFGVTACKREGHTLRSRAGNCIQCDHANIEMQLRHYRAAFLYIAGSQTLKLLKIGSSGNPEKRIGSFNADRPRGSSDWRVLASLYVKNAGPIETLVHQDLKHRNEPVQYYKKNNNGVPVTSFECYKANYSEARVILAYRGIGVDGYVYREVDDAKDYDFYT